MASNTELLAIAKRYLYPNYRPAPFALVRGSGCELFDADEKRWLDLSAGVAVCSVGHCHPVLVRAISEQAARLMHTSNYFYNEQNILLAEELCSKSKMDRAFFCNSGAEANEAMLKLARRYFYGRGEKSRARIVAFHNSFHGRTLGALSMTGTAKYREGFGDPGNVTHVAYGDLAGVKEVMGPDVAAIIVEPVQGEGGVLPAPPLFLRGLREMCDEAGALMLLDEVQTGLGRLGRFLGIEASGVRPDAIALAKGLGGGFPIGAMLVPERLAEALPVGTHGSTFGGNPLASAAARAVLKILDDENLVENAKKNGELLGHKLEQIAWEFPTVCEHARGEGLLRGLVLKQGFLAREVLGKIQEARVLLTAAGERVLRFSPPLVISAEQIEEGTHAVRRVIENLAKGAEKAASISATS